MKTTLEVSNIQKGLGYQAIKLKPTHITDIENRRLYYLKESTDKIIKRMKERNDFLSCENRRLQRQMASYKWYKKIMEEHFILSPHDLEVHFRGEKTWLEKKKEAEKERLKI